MTTVTLQDLAGEAYDAFTTTERGEETIVVLKDDAPEWVRELVHSAHGDMFPDDWRYDAIRSALGSIHDDEPDDLDEYAHEWADGHVDVYTARRLQWLASSLERLAYVDEAVEELGGSESSTAERIGLGQYAESMEVFASVAQSLRERADELENES